MGPAPALPTASGHLRTLSTQVEIQDLRDLDVDDPEKALVLSLELLLIEDLDHNHGRIVDDAVAGCVGEVE